ncbi:MAG: protoporphyrinogen oxidase [Alphaproteobacteria bacterium]
MSVDVAIIGGGVSGLAAAFALKRRGHSVVVLERAARPGGNAFSERSGGFLMEHGPSTVNEISAPALALNHTLGLERERCGLGLGVRNRYLVDGAGLAGIAAHPFGFFTAGYLSLAAKLRLMVEAFVPRRADGGEETVAQFCTRRFGAEFTARIMDPLVGGIYAGSAGSLSVSAIFPRLVEMEREYGSLIRAVIAKRMKGGRMPGRRLYSWRSGIAVLPRALAASLGESVKTGVTVRRVRPDSGGYRIDAGRAGTLSAGAVVLATQPHVAASMLEALAPDAAAAAAGIEAPPLAVVFVGYRREQVAHPLDGLGFLAAPGEGRAITGAQFCSTMFPGRAPEGFVSIAGYFGGARNPALGALPRGELVAIARAEFGDLIGARGEPVIANVRHWPAGLPQYGLGHARRIALLEAVSQDRPGLYVTGNYLHGPSVADCVALAQDTTAAVHEHLLDRAGAVAGTGRRVGAGDA